MSIEAEWIAVDWGTSNLRVWGVGRAGDVVFALTSDQGMGRLAPDAYAGTLTHLLAANVDPGAAGIDTLICGMAGARQGWMEAPYLEVPADLDRLYSQSVAPAVPDGRWSARILPGVCQTQAGAEDVMRGEETQLLGLGTLWPSFTGVVCMPGTHSKWVELAGHRVERFATAMTGELFDVLCTHSVLRHSLTGSRHGPNRDAGFESGLCAGISTPQMLSTTLFKVRAASLLSGRPPDWCAGFLSGLLIGAEISAQRAWIGTGEMAIVGDAGLAALYAKGVGVLGAKARIVDGTDATLAGLKTARQQR